MSLGAAPMDASITSTLVALLPAMRTTVYVFRIAVGCTLLYLAVRKALPKRSADFSNRAVSILHALVAILLCCWAIDWAAPFANIGLQTTSKEYTTLLVSLGYFLYDTVYCALIDKDVVNTAHHLSTIAGLVVGVYAKQSGTELVLCLLLMEVSNPFMHLRFMLKEAGLKDSRLALANELAFAATFTACRIVAGPYLVYHTLEHPKGSVIVKAGALAIQLVSLFWFWKILQVVLYKVSKASKPAKAKSQ